MEEDVYKCGTFLKGETVARWYDFTPWAGLRRRVQKLKDYAVGCSEYGHCCQPVYYQQLDRDCIRSSFLGGIMDSMLENASNGKVDRVKYAPL